MSPLKIVYYGLFSTALVALFINFRLLGKRHRVFIPLLSLGIVAQVVADILDYYNYPPSVVFHIYVPVEYALLSFYYSYMFSSRIAKGFFILSNLGLIAFCTIYYYTTPLFFARDFKHFVLLSSFVTTLVVAFFIKLYRDENEYELTRYPDFWINAGNLLFYACCFFVMGLLHDLANTNKELADKLEHINHYANFILYLFYIIAFTCPTRKPRSSRLSLQEQR